MCSKNTIVSKESFQRYCDVQKRGIVNMLSPQVCELVNISKSEHTYIIGHYAELCNLYNIFGRN